MFEEKKKDEIKIFRSLETDQGKNAIKLITVQVLGKTCNTIMHALNNEYIKNKNQKKENIRDD